ncbi:MAG: hypothetical protein FWF86_03965 [Clostridia bacterium]|nr:hypothetical protein [Clostridia bacterium]
MPINAKYMLLLGNYGSGKTELALALARERRKRTNGRVVLVDLDIVNPYFRSGEKRSLLEAEGVELLLPSFALSSVDAPSLPAQIQSVFESVYDHVIIDAGGDETGAAVLGRYHSYLSALRSQVAALYIVNTLRPLSGTVEDILSLFSLIEQRARIRPDYLVNNANLQNETSPEDLIQAQAILEKAARRLGIPIGMVVGEERLRERLPVSMQQRFFPIEPLMRPEWMVEAP